MRLDVGEVGEGGKAWNILNEAGEVTGIAYEDGGRVYYEFFATPNRYLPDVTEWVNYQGRRIPMMPKRPPRQTTDG